MLKRVSRILERQEKLAKELRELMPKQYLPGPSEGWDYPTNLEEWGDDLMRTWRKAVLEIGGPSIYLEDLAILLELKVEKIEQNARADKGDSGDDPDDDVDQPESRADFTNGATPVVGAGALKNQSILAVQKAAEVARI